MMTVLKIQFNTAMTHYDLNIKRIILFTQFSKCQQKTL